MMQLSVTEIEQISEKVGRPMADGVKIHLDVESIRAMRNSRFSMRQIAAWFDVSRPTLYRRLAEAVDGGTE